MRYVPAAVSPLYINEIVRCLWKSRNKNGLPKLGNELRKYFDKKHVFTFTSLMRSVYACLMVLKRERIGNKVLLPRYCCPSFIHGITAAGLEPEYVDINPCTLSINIDDLKGKAKDNVLALLVINMFGLCNPMDQIIEICKHSKITLIETVDYGIGTEYAGKKMGCWGDIAILNFQEGKAIPVGGGALITDMDVFANVIPQNPSKCNIAIMLGYAIFSRPKNYYWFRKATNVLNVDWKRFSMEDTIRKTRKENDYQWTYNETFNSISHFQAELAILILNRMESNIASRYRNSEYYKHNLSNITGVKVIEVDNSVGKIHYIRYPILVGNGKRNILWKTMLKNNIEASPMYSEHGMEINPFQYPGSHQVCNELLTLPCHPYVTFNDMGKTVAIIRKTMLGI